MTLNLFNLTSAAFTSEKNRMRMRFRIKICAMFTWFSILHYHLVYSCGKTESPCKSYELEKGFYKQKRLVDQMMHGKVIWKPGEIGKASKGIAPEPRSKGGGGVTAPHINPQLHARWAMAYDHKTQSFMENGGQQKCLDKSLRSIYESCYY